MALHPVGDQLKIKLDKSIMNLGPSKPGKETGIVTEVPEVIHYFGMHSSMMESSFMSPDLPVLLDYFKDLIGKRVVWESLQDRGRHFSDGDDTFVLLKMSDVIGFTDDPDEVVDASDDDRASSGSFAL